MSVLRVFYKDPNAILDYTLDWSLWLIDDDVIATSVWTVEAGITKDLDTKTDTTTTIWLSGGTSGVSYSVANRITTTGGRTEDRTLTFSIVQR